MPLILKLLITVAVAVFMVMLLTVVMSHRSRSQAKLPMGSLAMDLIWSAVPWLIVAGAVTPAVIALMRD
jgi:heme/copper-type cytochrome/quinol oxidase subunit 2